MTGPDGPTGDGRPGLHVEVVRDRLRVPRPHSLDEVARAAEVDRDVLHRVFVATQRLRDDDAYSDRDLDYAHQLRPLVDRFPVEQLERQGRVRARLVRSMAVADLRTAQLERTIEAAIEHGVDPDELGALVADVAEELVPASARLVAADYHDQLVRLLDTDAVARAGADLGRDVELAVGFVDLVGFTELSATADPDGVAEVLDAFEGLVDDEARAEGSAVTPTKTIGDAVMLVSADCDALAAVLLRVVTAPDVAGLEEVARRAGMAHGEVRVRDGDYVGTVVNRAARLTDLAYPGSLVTTHDAWDRMSDDRWYTSLLPPKHLKGLGTSRPLRVRVHRDHEPAEG